MRTMIDGKETDWPAWAWKMWESTAEDRPEGTVTDANLYTEGREFIYTINHRHVYVVGIPSEEQ